MPSTANRDPRRHPVAVFRHRHLDHVDPERRPSPSAARRTVDVYVGLRVRVTESFLQDPDAQAPRGHLERGDVAAGRHRSLPWIEPVGTGKDVEEQRVVGDGCRHRAEMIEHGLHDHRTRVRDEAVRRLHPVDAAERRRHADRTALIAADREVDDPAADQRRRTGRRPAGREPVLPRVVGLAQRVRVAAPRIAEVLAVRLAGDRRAGLEDAVDDRRVELGDVTLERRRAVHHRDARNGDVVLHGDACGPRAGLPRSR